MHGFLLVTCNKKGGGKRPWGLCYDLCQRFQKVIQQTGITSRRKCRNNCRRTVLLHLSLSKGIFEIWLRGLRFPESRHRRGKYLHCPDLRPGSWNKSGCPGKANRIFHQNTVPHQTFICPFFMVYYFLHKRHLSRRFLLSRFVPILSHKSIWCIKCRRTLPTRNTSPNTTTETCTVDASGWGGLRGSSTRLHAWEVWITQTGQGYCK